MPKRHDVADRQAVSSKVGRMVDVEGAVQSLQRFDLAAGIGKLAGVDQLIVLTPWLQPLFIQPVRTHKAQIGGGILPFELIDGKSVCVALQESLFPPLANEVGAHSTLNAAACSMIVLAFRTSRQTIWISCKNAI